MGSDAVIYANAGVGNGRLVLGSADGSSPNADRFGDRKSISLRGGELVVHGSSAATLAETEVRVKEVCR